MRLFGCWISLLLIVSNARVADAGAIFIPLGVENQARAVSDDGSVVVGVYNQDRYGTQAFRWTYEGGAQYLGDLPGGDSQSYGLAVSGDGSIVVGQGLPDSGKEAFRWTAATGMVGLGDLPGGNPISTALGISSDGTTIVGTSWGSDGIEAVRWEGGAAPPIGLGALTYGPNGQANDASADGTVIVGSDYARTPQTGPEAFRWTQATGMVGLGDAPGGGCCSEAEGVSDDGSVIVGRAWSGSGVLAMRWTQQTGMSLLGDLPGGESDSRAYAANGDGSTIVGVGNTSRGDEAFIWTASGMRNLQAMMLEELGIDLPEWKLQEARDISPDGSAIVGWGWNPSGQREGWLLIIPEPGTGLLVVAGLLGFAGWRRGRA